MKAFLDDVWRNGRPAFKLRTLGDDTGKTAVHVHREDLDAAYRTLPPHIAKRNRDLQDLTENHEATMAGAFSTRGSHLQEMIEMRDQEEAGARRRPDGSDEAASRAGLAFLLGAFGKEHDAAIKIQRAWRAFLLRRGPMDPNRMKQPHEKKIHHHYWEPLKREANLTKVDLLDRSREALKHAESAVARIERQKK